MIGEYIAPSIKVIHNAFDNIDEFFDKIQNVPREFWHNSSIWQDKDRSIEYMTDASIRNSNELGVPYGLDKPRVFFELAHTIYNAALEYAAENGFSFSHMEELNLLEYEQNQGFFDRHADGGPSYPRSMSALLYLNTVEEGGETWFDKFNMGIKPEKNKLVLFPANYPYSHQAMPPVSGKKYVVVTWFGQFLENNIFERYYSGVR